MAYKIALSSEFPDWPVCQAQYFPGSTGNVGGPYSSLEIETLAFSKPSGGTLLQHGLQMSYFLCEQTLVVCPHVKLAFSARHNFKAFCCSSSLQTRSNGYLSLSVHFVKSHDKAVPQFFLCHVLCLWMERNDGRPTHWWSWAAVFCHCSFLSTQLKSVNNHGMLVTPKSLVAFIVFVLVRGNCPTLFLMDFSLYKYFFNKIHSAEKNQSLLAAK